MLNNILPRISLNLRDTDQRQVETTLVPVEVFLSLRDQKNT